MSLDIYLKTNDKTKIDRNNSTDEIVPIRRNGRTVKITVEEWYKINPDIAPVIPSYVNVINDEIYSDNITHNLGRMADAAGLYEALWRPEENGLNKAYQLVPILSEGLNRLKSYPEAYKTLNPKNGWGDYNVLVTFVEKYLKACRENLDTNVSVCR